MPAEDVRVLVVTPTEVPAWVGDAVFYQVFPDRFARSDRAHATGPLEAWDAAPTHGGVKGDDAAVTLTPAGGSYTVTVPARTGRFFTP